MKIPNWMKITRIGMREYAAAFCITVFLAVFLLAVAAFLPQTVIQNHVAESIPLISRDIENHYLFDNSTASKLDVGTDLMMLQTSLATNDSYLGSILTNPVYSYDDLGGWEDDDELLARLSYGMPADDVWFYARYWMGFRVALRLALTFFTYAQIKRYLSFLFFSLFAAAVCSVSKHTNSRAAFLFALSIILVRPHVMATSMQLSCCFLLAFGAMVLIPWLHRHDCWEPLFFLELGMVTMYFDFYTVPLVTVGFPLMYLCLVKQKAGLRVSYRDLLRSMTAWFLGYGLMWVAKLGLTSLLTSVDALRQGFQSFFSRVGIEKDAGLTEFYSLEAALEGVGKAVFSDETGAVVYLLCAGMLLVSVAHRLWKGGRSAVRLKEAAPYLCFALLPFIWFWITKQPVAIHYYFQYRTIALTHWAAGVFAYSLLPVKSGDMSEIQ